MKAYVGAACVRAAYVVAALVLTAGCTAYRPLSRPPLPRDEVKLTFLSPRNLVGRTEEGRTVPLNRVNEIRGRIASIAGDTMRVFVASARGPDGDVRGLPSDVIVAIARDWYPTVQEAHMSAKPIKTVGYIALAALAVLVLAIGLALDSTD